MLQGIDGVRNNAALTGSLLADYTITSGDRLLINVGATKRSGGGGDRDYNVYFGNQHFSFINLRKEQVLNDLGDVLITAPQNGQGLVYNGGQFSNQPFPTTVRGAYVDTTDLVNNDANNVIGSVYYVADASGDPVLTSGYAYYEKVANLNYRLLSSEEGLSTSSETTIAAEYANLPAAIADQTNQVAQSLYHILDASGFD